jgi:hypothetical protein
VEYHAGKQNKVADILSRRLKDQPNLASLSMPHLLFFIPFAHRFKIQTNCNYWSKIYSKAKLLGLGSTRMTFFFLSDEFNCYMILLLFHLLSWLSIIVAMRDIIKTLHRVAQDFYWQGMKTYIQAFVRQRLACQEHKTEHLHSTGLLQPLPVPLQIWSNIFVDFIEGLSTS